MPRRSHARALQIGAALLLGTALAPASARACSYAGEPTFTALYPTANAVDVPTNAAVLVRAALTPDSLVLLDAAGASVPFDLHELASQSYELVPHDELAPQQSYRLVVMYEPSEALLAFTTGAGPAALPARLEPPELDAWVFEISDSIGYGDSVAVSSCGVQDRVCVVATAPADTSFEILVGSRLFTLPQLTEEPLFLPSGGRVGTNTCVEVRVRDIAGNRSQPSIACGDALPRYRVRPPDFNFHFTCANYESHIEADSAGPTDIDGSDTPDVAGTSTDGASTDGASTDGTSTDGTSTDGTSTDGTSTDGTSTDGTVPADTSHAPSDIARSAAPDVTASASASCAIASPSPATALGSFAASLVGLATLFARRRRRA